VKVWALPACNPWGNLEFTFGGGRQEQRRNATRDYMFQFKTLFPPWRPMAGAGPRRRQRAASGHQPGPNLLGNTFVYVPISFSFADDKVVLHHNLGWLKDKATGDHRLTWGGRGVSREPTPHGHCRSLRRQPQRPFWQAGARFAIVPERVQVDATFGRELNGSTDNRWFSFGLRLTPTASSERSPRAAPQAQRRSTGSQ
jgi:hypothetical protein